MDVAALIERHRRRLDDHKRALSSAGTPASEAAGPPAAPPGEQLPLTGASPPLFDEPRSHSIAADSEAAAAPCDAAHHSFSAASGGAGRHRAADHRHDAPHSPAPTGHHGGKATAGPAAASSPRAGSYAVTDDCALFDRSQQWLARREQNRYRAAAAAAESESQECVFQPNVSLASRQLLEQPPPPITPSFQRHVQRAEAARREKAEAERRLVPDTSKWTPRVTQTREFAFGRRCDAPIPSLRRPVWGGIDLDRDDGGGADGGGADGGGTFPLEPDELGAPPAAPASGPSTPRAARSAGRSGGVVRGAPRGGPSVREVVAAQDAMERELAASRREVARLNGVNAGLQRELEVARAKIRQMALAD